MRGVQPHADGLGRFSALIDARFESATIMNPITLVISIAFVIAAVVAGEFVNLYLAPPLFIIAILVMLSIKIANVWEKFVILRVGKLQSVKGAGFFMIIPIIDNVVAIIDERIQTTAFNAEQALTKDTVPVNVDAIIFWHVNDAQKAALAITDYRQAIDRVAQTSLRELIGSTMLAELLSDRAAADSRLDPSKSVMWRSQSRCRMRCRVKHKRSGKSRHG
jgi:regulator of protease activity HflC (stomatin/prohibitin superfamily)